MHTGTTLHLKLIKNKLKAINNAHREFLKNAPR